MEEVWSKPEEMKSTVWDCSTFLESIHWSAVGCDSLTAVHITIYLVNSPDVSRQVCLSSGLDRGPRDCVCVCPSVLELVSVNCPSSRRRSSCRSTFCDYSVFGIVTNVFIVYLLVLE